uniref:MARVEL domain-containing protein n=1 Tax=Ascaris lumbricoides TaxID=6252 RepID=A0A9J2PQS3_ASCLU
MSLCLRSIPWGSLNAAVISIVGCLTFAILFDGAMEGFSMQVNTLFPLGSFTFRWVIASMTIFFILLAITFLFVGATSTSVSVKLSKKPESLDDASMLSKIITSRFLLGAFTLSTMALVLLWALVVCMSAVLTSLYFVFIGAIYSFCALVDQQCFDFTVLLPALINRLSNKKVDLTFCKDKKEALCAKEHNQIWPFIGSFLCSLLALVGLVYFLMCMTANYTRLRSEGRARKGEHYAINQGTVDSNSFIMTNMGK